MRCSPGSIVDTLGPALSGDRVTKKPAARGRADIRFMDVGASLVRYRTSGAGVHTIVFAVDPPIVVENYDLLSERLAPHVRAIVFEAPGFGFSYPRLCMDFGFESVTASIEMFLEQLNEGPYILAFPCVGGYSAVALAAQRPDLVAGVVLIQTPSWPEELTWKKSRDKKGVLSRPVIGQIALQMLKRGRAAQWVRYAAGTTEAGEVLAKNVLWALDHGACFCLASAFQEYLTPAPPPLSPVAQPCLIVWGESDRSHRTTDRRSSLALAPNGEIISMENAGHFPELEDPELFSSQVLHWLDRIC